MKGFSVAVVLLGLVVWGGVAHAGQVYDVAADWSLASNPNGVWTYGQESTLGGAFSAYTQTSTNGGLEHWYSSNANPPEVAYNPTATDIDIPGTGETFLAHKADFHPGFAGEYSVYRFTAPSAGTYVLDSSFWGVNPKATTDVHVLLNNVVLFSGSVNGQAYGAGPAFDTSLVLAAGDHVDFEVGYGSDGSNSADATGIEARLTTSAVPEPSSLVLMGFGLTGLIRFVCRRKKATNATAPSRP